MYFMMSETSKRGYVIIEAYLTRMHAIKMRSKFTSSQKKKRSFQAPLYSNLSSENRWHIDIIGTAANTYTMLVYLWTRVNTKNKFNKFIIA